MSLDDWILALHLLAAFVLVGAVVAAWVVVAAARSADGAAGVEAPLRLVPVIQPMTAIGGTGTLIFGIWLALSLEAYELWDAWIIVSLVLWVIAAATGETSGARYKKAGQRASELVRAGSGGPDAELDAMVRDGRAFAFHVVATVAALVILILMIWKPGA
ncbi:MAG: DUF2269 family protein [Thermoleophilia bacterium]